MKSRLELIGKASQKSAVKMLLILLFFSAVVL